MAAVPQFTIGKLVTDSTQPGDGIGVIIRVHEGAKAGRVVVLFLNKLMTSGIPLNGLAARADRSNYVREINTNQLVLNEGSLSEETVALYRGQILSQVAAAAPGAAVAAAPVEAQISFLSKIKAVIADGFKSCGLITGIGLVGLLYLYFQSLEHQRLASMSSSEVLLEGALDGIAELLFPTDGAIAGCSVMGGAKRKQKSKKASKRRKYRLSRRI